MSGPGARAWVVALVVLAAAGGCARLQRPRHVLPYKQKQRDYRPEMYASPDAARSPGSLWSEGAYNLFEDARARRVGDIVTIFVLESANAKRDSSTALRHRGDTQLGVSAFYTAILDLVRKNPGLDPNALLQASTTNDFSGGGGITRSGDVKAVLPVRIKEALPNGDFYLEGSKVLLLNEEESLLYISGVVRPIDIAPDNSVSSTQLADVELEYTGRGIITESERVGWGKRLLNYIWPF